MVRQFIVFFALAGLLGLVAPSPVMGQDKGKEEAAKKKKAEELKKDISKLKMQNRLLQRRIRSMQYLIKVYRKRLQEQRNPVKYYSRQLTRLAQRLQIAFMRRGIKGVLQELERAYKRFFGPKRFRRPTPRKRYRRRYRKKSRPTPPRIHRSKKGDSKTSVKWYKSLAKAKAVAAKKNKPLIVKVGAPW